MSRRLKLEQILDDDPSDVFAHYALAMELLKENRAEDALNCFDRALALDSGYTAAYYHKGNTLLTLGRHSDAQKTLEAGIAAARKAGDSHALEEMNALLATAVS